jgi:hypothetical protein
VVGNERLFRPDTVFVQGDMAMMLIAVARANMAWIVDVGKKKRRKKAIVASPRGLDRWLGWESSGR